MRQRREPAAAAAEGRPGSHRERVSRAKLALSVYPIIRLPSFLASPYARPSFSLFRTIEFFYPSLSRSSCSLLSRRAILCAYRACKTPIFFLCSRFLPHSALSSLLVCSLSAPPFLRSLLSISLSYRRSFFSLLCFLLVVLSPPERCHPEAAFVSFLLIRLLLFHWSVGRFFVSLSRFLEEAHRTETHRELTHFTSSLFLPLLLLFLLFHVFCFCFFFFFFFFVVLS